MLGPKMPEKQPDSSSSFSLPSDNLTHIRLGEIQAKDYSEIIYHPINREFLRVIKQWLDDSVAVIFLILIVHAFLLRIILSLESIFGQSTKNVKSGYAVYILFS